MIEKRVVVGPFQCNCRILICEETGLGAMIDPGDESDRILSEIDQLESTLNKPVFIRFLLHTHAHLDHIGATSEVKKRLAERQGSQVPEIYLHRDDEKIYQNLKMQGELFGMNLEDPTPVEKYLEDGQELWVGKLKLSIIHTPGHSPGGICLRLHEDSVSHSKETLYSGDTLFQNSVGRTDLWGGDMDILVKSIKERIFPLDGDTLLCPGHGPDSRVGLERRDNPFFK